MDFNKVFKDLPEKLVLDILKTIIIGGILYVINLISKSFIDRFFADNKQLGTYFFVLLCLIFVYTIIRLFQKYRHHHTPNFPHIDTDFLILSQTFIHKVISKTEIHHTRKYKLKSLRNGLIAYKDQFQWTGNRFEISSANPSHKLVTLPKNNAYDVVEIMFDCSLNKKDTIDVELNWKLYDDTGVSSPFICANIYEPTQHLNIDITFDKSLGVKQIVCQEVVVSKGSLSRDTAKRVDLPENCNFDWKIAKPKLLHRYEIKWNY